MASKGRTNSNVNLKRIYNYKIVTITECAFVVMLTT